jgi:hypothetical protein
MKKILTDKPTPQNVKAKTDEGLVAMFIKMTPEQRLTANDNAARAILELRHGFRQTRTSAS